MGWNTTVVVLNDYLDMIAGDQDFGDNLACAIRRLNDPGIEKPVPVRAGCTPRAAVVVETHDGYAERGVLVGNNTGVLAEMELLGTRTIDPSEPLEPCPFCGGKAVLDEQDGHGARLFNTLTYAVRCISCGASGPWEKNPKGPVHLWNKRER